MSLLDRIRPELAAFRPYVSARRAGHDARIRLDANESPWDAATGGGALESGLNRYPEPQPAALRERLAALYGTTPDALWIGRGSDEAIDLLLRLFCRAGRDNVVTHVPTFGMYRIATALQGAELRAVATDPARGFALDADALLAQVDEDTRIVIVCSPNNPTGTRHPRATLARIAAALADRALLLVDEAYVEFADEPDASAVALLADHANVAMLRTLSKAHALAGARIGTLIARPDLIGCVAAIAPPYPLPIGSVRAALAALAPEALARTRERIAMLRSERARVAAALETSPLVRALWPSEGNFVLARFDDASAAFARLLAADVLVRDFSSQPGLSGCLRITIGRPDENDTMLRALDALPPAAAAAAAPPAAVTGGPLRILFVDRDGTLIEEPDDQQIDAFDKFRLVPGTIHALRRFVAAGYELVMVSNQDGLGTASFPEPAFRGPQRLLLDILASEGIAFREALIDRSFPQDHAPTRKPGVGLVRHYLGPGVLDRVASVVVGDRETDLEFARNLGLRGLRIGPDFGWEAIAAAVLDRPRTAHVTRATRETRITVDVDLDAATRPHVATGIGFFDHMLEQLGVHGGFALRVACDGDLAVDEHHSVEDTALALGRALRDALGDRRGIARYGFMLPMDESLASAALDLSGRPCFVFEGAFPRERVGELATELVPHFFRSLSDALGATLHLSVRGENAHHMVEACFKAVGRVLRQAIRREGDAVPSSKGTLGEAIGA